MVQTCYSDTVLTELCLFLHIFKFLFSRGKIKDICEKAVCVSHVFPSHWNLRYVSKNRICPHSPCCVLPLLQVSHPWLLCRWQTKLQAMGGSETFRLLPVSAPVALSTNGFTRALFQEIVLNIIFQSGWISMALANLVQNKNDICAA